jgi:hypothetical protein
MLYSVVLLGYGASKHQVVNTWRTQNAVTMGTRCWSFPMQSTHFLFQKNCFHWKISELKNWKFLVLSE